MDDESEDDENDGLTSGWEGESRQLNQPYHSLNGTSDSVNGDHQFIWG